MQDTEIVQLLKSLDERLLRIERMAGVVPPEPTAEAPVPEAPTEAKARWKMPSNILGMVGVGCLILATILLIKFSIDSGWLTPPRQMILSFLFGIVLMALPFVWKSDDQEYLSLLPAGGVVVFHLTIYGSIFIHRLLPPEFGIWLVWGVGCLSLALLNHFRHSIYAVLAIAGTYFGFVALGHDQGLIMKAFFLLIWDLIFTAFGVYLASRGIIVLTAYFCLGLVALMDAPPLHHAVIQMLQALVIAGTTAYYSVRNRQPLTDKDSRMLFFVFLFFYGIEYNNLNKLSPSYAIAFSLGFSGLIMGLYLFARQKLARDHLDSTRWILTLVATMLMHSVFIVVLDDLGKVIAGLLILLGIAVLGERIKDKSLRGVLVLAGLAVAYSLLLVTFNGDKTLRSDALVALGFIYGALFIAGGMLKGHKALLMLAHFMNVVAIARLGEFIGEFWIGPLCVVYAFGILFLAFKRADKLLAKSAFPLIFFAIGRFLFYTFDHLGQGERIISLLIMGALIYGSGFLYRKIPNET